MTSPGVLLGAAKMNLPAEGGCRCRAIRYRVTAEPMFAFHGNCRDCQYASGGAGSTVVLSARDSVTDAPPRNVVMPDTVPSLV